MLLFSVRCLLKLHTSIPTQHAIWPYSGAIHMPSETSLFKFFPQFSAKILNIKKYIFVYIKKEYIDPKLRSSPQVHQLFRKIRSAYFVYILEYVYANTHTNFVRVFGDDNKKKHSVEIRAENRAFNHQESRAQIMSKQQAMWRKIIVSEFFGSYN